MGEKDRYFNFFLAFFIFLASFLLLHLLISSTTGGFLIRAVFTQILQVYCPCLWTIPTTPGSGESLFVCFVSGSFHFTLYSIFKISFNFSFIFSLVKIPLSLNLDMNFVCLWQSQSPYFLIFAPSPRERKK